MSKEKTLVLVDGSALAFRSFYALFTSHMHNHQGMPTWAVYGFFKALFDLIEHQLPDMIAVCFDLKEPTFRHIEYEQYKANRLEMPDDLALQWPLIKTGITALAIPIYELAGYEADDIIGTVAKKAEQFGYKVTILTGDQDAFQLLDGYIQVLMPGREGLTIYGRGEVKAKLGVWPEQIIDYKALCGDTSDNIPGVKGIGPKTAAHLLTKYTTLENIYENLNQITSASVKQKLLDGQENAFQSKRLATILLDVPIDFDFEHCQLNMPDVKKVVDYLRELEFNSILKRLAKVLAPFNQGIEPLINPEWLTPVAAKHNVPGTHKAQGVTDFISATKNNAEQISTAPINVSLTAQLQPEIVRTEAELKSLIERLEKQTLLSVDLETTGLNSLDCEIVGYALAWSDTAHYAGSGKIAFKGDNCQCAYIPVRHIGETLLSPDYVASALKPILEAKTIGKIAQNAKFETNVLSLLGIQFGPLAFDSMLASYITNPDDNHGLKDQAEHIFGYNMVRITELIGTGRKQITMDAVPIVKAAPYAADDARVALELTRYYCPRLDADQCFLLWEMELPLSAVLAKMEQNGVTLDLPYLKKFSDELTFELQRLESEVHNLAGHSFNLNSTQQLQKVLYEELKLPVNARFKTKSGGYSTDATVLETLIDEHPIISKIMEYRQNSKLRSTYVDALPKQISTRDGRLHGEFNQVATATGRLSSSHPNLQNIPIKTPLGRRIRRAFIPKDKDALIISADYSQIELRLLAHMSGDETLIDAFQRDQDVHARTAMAIFDVPLDKVTPEMRRVGKTINFSLIYQQGAYSTAQDLGISTREAQKFIDKYFQSYPKVRAFMENTIAECRRKGFAQTLWGRRRYFRYLNDKNEGIRRADERAAANAPLQGSAADLMKLAMLRLDQEIQAKHLSAKLILQVHDELVLEVPQTEELEAKQTLLNAMLMDQPFNVPLKVDIGVGKTWMDVK